MSRVLAVDEQLRTSKPYTEQRLLREFALFSYRNVANDIVNGYGPFLDAVAEAFRPACQDRALLDAWLRALLARSDSSTDFARRLGVAHELALVLERAPSANR